MMLDENSNDVDHDKNEEKRKLLYLLTKHGVSMEFYHELTMIYPSLIRSHQVHLTYTPILIIKLF